LKPAVKPKKHFGQHFLNDETIAMHIADALPANQTHVLEIGPGTGVLTKYLFASPIARYRN
jgi:16S rRNA (adenine1518-N6/adenine1519-N6)-dimethyltransferase